MAQESSSSSQSTSLSEPYAPEYIPKAGATIDELKAGAYSAADAQKVRLADYVNHLGQLRDLAKKQARGAGARVGGQQNPLAVYQALNQMAAEAGIPMDAEIGKALQNSNSIENTLNSLIAKAGDAQIALANIQKHTQQSTSQSSSGGGGGGGGANAGGGNRGNPRAQGQNLDLNGNPKTSPNSESKAPGPTSGKLDPNGNKAQGLDPWGQPVSTSSSGGIMTDPTYNAGLRPGAISEGPGNWDGGNAGSDFNPFTQQNQMDSPAYHGAAWDTLSSGLPGANNWGIGGDNFNSSHLNFDVPQWDDSNPFGGTGGGPSYAPQQEAQGGFQSAQDYGQFPQGSPSMSNWNDFNNWGAGVVGDVSNWWDQASSGLGN